MTRRPKPKPPADRPVDSVTQSTRPPAPPPPPRPADPPDRRAVRDAAADFDRDGPTPDDDCAW